LLTALAEKIGFSQHSAGARPQAHGGHRQSKPALFLGIFQNDRMLIRYAKILKKATKTSLNTGLKALRVCDYAFYFLL